MKTGPKIIMIGKMMVDFVLFLFLIAIFLITYGICSQVLVVMTNFSVLACRFSMFC